VKRKKVHVKKKKYAKVMTRVKAKKKKTTIEGLQKKKVEKIQVVLYTGKRFQNRAFRDSESFSLDLVPWDTTSNPRRPYFETLFLYPY
jgi:hypothetical protein